MLKKAEAEPGPDGAPRWVGTGRTVFDNKGNPVKKYEPYFSSTFEYEDDPALVMAGRSREVPLNAVALQTIKAHRHLRGAFVFCDATGAYLKNDTCRNAILRASKRAGLRPIGWHTLRHSFASHLVAREVPLKAVQELLGHATIEMTMRYAHLSPDVKKDAVRARGAH